MSNTIKLRVLTRTILMPRYFFAPVDGHLVHVTIVSVPVHVTFTPAKEYVCYSLNGKIQPELSAYEFYITYNDVLISDTNMFTDLRQPIVQRAIERLSA